MRCDKLRVWFAPEDKQGGQKLIEQIDRAIQVNDRLLLVLSEHSLNSEWVQTEIRKARHAELREKRQKLFPIRLVSLDRIRDWNCFDADTGKDFSLSNSAKTTSPTSRTGKTTTPSSPPSPTCSAICWRLRRRVWSSHQTHPKWCCGGSRDARSNLRRSFWPKALFRSRRERATLAPRIPPSSHRRVT